MDEPLLLAARERRRLGDSFFYDLDILGTDGTLRERWRGLELRAVATIEPPAAWSAPLLAPYLERRLQELLPELRLRVALEPAGRPPATGSAVAAGRPHAATSLPQADRAVDTGRPPVSTAPPPAGRAVAAGRPPVSTSPPPADRAADAGRPPASAVRAAGLVLAVHGEGPGGLLGCGLELVAERPPAAWREPLDGERLALAGLIAGRLGEEPEDAAARVHAVTDALRRAGGTVTGTPLLAPAALDRAPGTSPPVAGAAGGWLLWRAGGLQAATFVGAVREAGGRCAFAFVAGVDAAATPAAVLVAATAATTATAAVAAGPDSA
jgi:enediyne polyketide synthase